MDRKKEKIFRFNIFKASILENIRIMDYLMGDENINLDDLGIDYKLQKIKVNNSIGQFLAMVENTIMESE